MLVRLAPAVPVVAHLRARRRDVGPTEGPPPDRWLAVLKAAETTRLDGSGRGGSRAMHKDEPTSSRETPAATVDDGSRCRRPRHAELCAAAAAHWSLAAVATRVPARRQA